MNFETKTNNEDVLKSSIESLAKYRTEIANLKRFEDEAKDRIATILSSMNKTAYASDKYFCECKEVKTNRFDSKLAKEYLGDKAKEFMKESTSIRIQVKEIIKWN